MPGPPPALPGPSGRPRPGALVGLALFLAACAGDGAGRRTGPGGPAADAAPSPLAGPGPECGGANLFVERCSGGVCHHSGASPARGLDLLSPDPATRLVAVESTCAGRLLIDPGNPDESFLLVKVREDAPGCDGARMPNGGDPLAPAEITCLEAWVRDRALAGRVVP